MPEAWQVLAVRNRHPRDQHIVMDEPTHVYTVKGSSRGYVSVTKFLHCFFPSFDADKVITKLMASAKWPEHELYGKTPAEIKAIWSANGTEASTAGTRLHLAIEQFLNGAEHLIAADIKTTPEWTYFLRFWAKYGTDLEPFRLEWEVFVEELKLAGSIDGVFRRKSDGAFFIYDWKRAKDIKMENPFENGFAPVDHLPNSNYWQYSLQLNTYRYILENYYGLHIEGMYLVVLHPNFPSFRRVEVARMDEEMEAIMATRRLAVEDGGRRTVILPAKEH